MIRPPPISTLFPYTTLSRSRPPAMEKEYHGFLLERHAGALSPPLATAAVVTEFLFPALNEFEAGEKKSVTTDPKRTRLNSRHLVIFYSAFFLEKKKNTSLSS